ncbi:phage tail family protein [Butyricicoccus sp. 1XD8-22]|nr:phage tail family protein [Butyricicoccus sp. 1XD8-22]
MIIELLNGTRFDIADYSLKRLFHRIPSAEISHDTATVEGMGDIITQTTILNRTISVELLYIAQDIYDYYLLRDELNELFTRDDAFYIIFKREPYKRWKVKLAQQFATEPNPRMEPFTVEFRTVDKYAESIADTSTIKEWDVDKWGWNGTIDWDEDLTYTFNTNLFVVKNLGNVPIDPCESELEIIVKGEFPNGLTIRNETTGDIYQYKSTLSSTDELVLKGIRTLKNGISDFKNTNKKLLTLAVGNNSITVEGGTLTSIAFNFRFLYK